MRKPNAQQLLDELQTLVQQAGFAISKDVCIQAIEYLFELHRWNQVHNLTSITDLREMLKVHLLDSWSVLSYLPKGQILDLGTGAGLPGIPLALAAPDRTYVLLDSRRKKTDFLEHIVRHLKLSHVQVVCSRAENYHPETLFDGVISRAVGTLEYLMTLSEPLSRPGGLILAMKSQIEEKEINALIREGANASTYNLKIPGWNVSRVLVCLTL